MIVSRLTIRMSTHQRVTDGARRMASEFDEIEKQPLDANMNLIRASLHWYQFEQYYVAQDHGLSTPSRHTSIAFTLVSISDESQ